MNDEGRTKNGMMVGVESGGIQTFDAIALPPFMMLS
jgi:hypothetical protein